MKENGLTLEEARIEIKKGNVLPHLVESEPSDETIKIRKRLQE